jgi:hypothetical protein
VISENENEGEFDLSLIRCWNEISSDRDYYIQDEASLVKNRVGIDQTAPVKPTYFFQ